MSKTNRMSFILQMESGKKTPLQFNVKPAGVDADMKTEIFINGIGISRKQVLVVLNDYFSVDNLLEYLKREK